MMADAESSLPYTVESFDYSTSTGTFTWRGASADEAVSQFLSAMDTAAEDEEAWRYLPFHRERFIERSLAELLTGNSVTIQMVANQRITLTRNSK
jgi:hypothetical protein